MERSLTQAVARFEGFRKNIPPSIRESVVNEYHSIVDSLAAAIGEDLTLFKIRPDELKHKVVAVRPAPYGGGRGSATYSSDRYCDNSRFQAQVDSLAEYLESAGHRHRSGGRNEPPKIVPLIIPVSDSLASSNAADDRKFAQIALDEARKSIPEDGRVHPKVGVVVVRDGRILATAHRGEIPRCHAEFIALEKKLPEVSLSGATVYTTLEPCTARNHPKVPCAIRLAERKVARVVIGVLDPDHRISGQGQRTLRKAGVITDLFPHDLMAEVEELNREFMRERESHEPTLKAPLYTDDDERKKMIDSVVLTIRTDNGHQRNYTILVENHSQFDVEIKRICLWSKDQTTGSGNDQRVSKPAFRSDNANWSVPARRSIPIQFDAQEDVAQRLWQLAGYPEDVDRWTAKKLGSARQFQIEVRVVLRCEIFGLERDFEDTRTVQVDFINRNITGV